MIEGDARGNWYDHGDFSVRLLDSSGKELGRAHAVAQGEWMTINFVPFRAQLYFVVHPKTTAGVLVFEKDNPSGLPENADELRIPVMLKPDPPPPLPLLPPRPSPFHSLENY